MFQKLRTNRFFGPKTPFSYISALIGPFYGPFGPFLTLFNTQTPFLALLGEICWLSMGGVGPRTFITRSLAMSWEAKARFLGLSWETVLRTSSGKFMRVERCYLESFGFLRLWSCKCEGFSVFYFSSRDWREKRPVSHRRDSQVLQQWKFSLQAHWWLIGR